LPGWTPGCSQPTIKVDCPVMAEHSPYSPELVSMSEGPLARTSEGREDRIRDRRRRLKENTMPGITHRSEKKPLLNTRFLSHGTLEIHDIAASRRFYEEVLGLEVVQQSTTALFVRLGGSHVYTCVETKTNRSEMPMLNHNGLDLGSREEVDEAHQKILEVQEEYGIRRVTTPSAQHGGYSFYLQDLDGNWWEILYLPEGGYSFRFNDSRFDLTGRTDLTKTEIRQVFRNAMDEAVTDADNARDQ
jgi:predicted lactoylglutathione lyase